MIFKYAIDIKTNFDILSYNQERGGFGADEAIEVPERGKFNF